MSKSTLTIVVAAGLILLGAGCTSVVTLEKPSVTYQAMNSGSTLRLTWNAVTDAKNYEIKTDNIDTTVASTVYSFDVTTPTTSISVYAVSGSDKSDPFTLDCKAAVTSSITVYGTSDPDSTHPSGIGFGADGTALGVSVKTQASQVEFVMDDKTFTGSDYLMSPIAYTPEINSWGNASQDAGADFDSVKIAPATGNYNTQTVLAVNGTYAAWLDHNNDGAVDATDHFAKLKIESINSTVVTVKLAYQKIGGLRWLE